MTDIYDIKDLLLWFPLNIFNTIIFLLFLFFIFFLDKIFFKKKNIKIVKKIKKGEVIVKKTDFNKILSNFEKKYLDKDFQIFYSKLAYILKEIIKQKENKDVSKMTFKEIEKFSLDNDLKNLIKQIYFREYSKDLDDNVEIRKSLINKVKKYLKNYNI